MRALVLLLIQRFGYTIPASAGDAVIIAAAADVLRKGMLADHHDREHDPLIREVLLSGASALGLTVPLTPAEVAGLHPTTLGNLIARLPAAIERRARRAAAALPTL